MPAASSLDRRTGAPTMTMGEPRSIDSLDPKQRQSHSPRVTRTTDPCARIVPGAGFCLTTLPLSAVAPASLLTLPILHPASLSRRFDVFRDLLLSLGRSRC